MDEAGVDGNFQVPRLKCLKAKLLGEFDNVAEIARQTGRSKK